jgi:DNA-binding XRE family transcriptional regulator
MGVGATFSQRTENMAERKVSNSNNVQQLREDQLLSKAELARRAGVSVLTIDRVERGESCRLDTKRKIILALGLKVADKDQVFEGAPKASGGRKF